LLEQLKVKIPVAELFGKLKVLVLFVLFGSVHLSLLFEFTCVAPVLILNVSSTTILHDVINNVIISCRGVSPVHPELLIL
jgi:hypothetical protein